MWGCSNGLQDKKNEGWQIVQYGSFNEMHNDPLHDADCQESTTLMWEIGLLEFFDYIYRNQKRIILFALSWRGCEYYDFKRICVKDGVARCMSICHVTSLKSNALHLLIWWKQSGGDRRDKAWTSLHRAKGFQTVGFSVRRRAEAHVHSNAK